VGLARPPTWRAQGCPPGVLQHDFAVSARLYTGTQRTASFMHTHMHTCIHTRAHTHTHTCARIRALLWQAANDRVLRLEADLVARDEKVWGGGA
jgi:hypothetical protein